MKTSTDAIGARDAADPPVPLRLSIIIPVRNEAHALAIQESTLLALRNRGHEVIVVDGGSLDRSVEIARRFATHVLVTPPGRARQMNAGADVASGAILLFLHADVLLPSGDFTDWLPSPESGGAPIWGCFPVRLDSPKRLYRLIAAGINVRAHATGVVSGDQALWVRRDCFERMGGFAEILLMEDIELSKRLRKQGPPVSCRSPVTVSARRWKQGHPIRLVIRMWILRIAYACGVPPQYLVGFYDRSYPRDWS
ncbi:MAG: TIGR04283 family arsenosugar biosynthesis glycosyltransferase [Gammaproteobacteria bacterium]